MHDPDGPTPKPASTWGNTTGVALHNVHYRTSASGLPAAPETPPRGGALAALEEQHQPQEQETPQRRRSGSGLSL